MSERRSDPDPFEDHLRHPTNRELMFVRNGLVISILNKDKRMTDEQYQQWVETTRRWLDEWDIPEGFSHLHDQGPQGPAA